MQAIIRGVNPRRRITRRGKIFGFTSEEGIYVIAQMSPGNRSPERIVERCTLKKHSTVGLM